jgi:dihydrodipicolinate reductase
MSYKIAINGLGRIGRAMLKLLVHHPQLEIVAANDLIDAKTLPAAIRYHLRTLRTQSFGARRLSDDWATQSNAFARKGSFVASLERT